MSTNALAMCLKNPTDAPAIMKSMKILILKHSYHRLPPIPHKVSWAKYVAIVTKATSSCWLWDLALDKEHGASKRC